MEFEKIINKETSYSASIAASKVTSLRVSDDKKTVIRVYQDGKIGIAGRIGDGDDKQLLEEAKEKLSQNIGYPCNLTENAHRQDDNSKQIIHPNDYVKTLKRLMERLNKCYPEFIFSNKVNMGIDEVIYENSKNTKYCYKESYLNGALIMQRRGSANIMDLAYGVDGTEYDEDKIVSDIGKLVKAYGVSVAMPNEKLPIMIGGLDVLQYSAQHLIAELYVSGSSLLSGKLGQKVFNEKVNILTNRSDEYRKHCFFDAEGVVNKDDRYYFVKDGVFSGVATYKRSAANFDLPLSGGAYSNFDSVPQANFGGLQLGRTDKLNNLVKGKAIYVVISSGGDMTPDGTVGLPVQLAYLYDNGKLVGRLPEFGIKGNIFDLLGKDFIGVAHNDVFEFSNEDVLVANFDIN